MKGWMPLTIHTELNQNINERAQRAYYKTELKILDAESSRHAAGVTYDS
jgi:hypothetical protein